MVLSYVLSYFYLHGVFHVLVQTWQFERTLLQKLKKIKFYATILCRFIPQAECPIINFKYYPAFKMSNHFPRCSEIKVLNISKFLPPFSASFSPSRRFDDQLQILNHIQNTFKPFHVINSNKESHTTVLAFLNDN